MTSDQSPSTTLLKGVAVLRPILEPYGFTFHLGTCGSSSGGDFASGRFERDDCILELHVRSGLGLVSYRIGETALEHEDWLRFSDQWAEHQYPNFGSTPMTSFQALAHDISLLCGDFVYGTGGKFEMVAAVRAADPDRFKGFRAIGRK